MNKKRLLAIISFIFSLTVLGCNNNGDKTNDLELIYFGKKIENQQQEKDLNKKLYYLKNESVDGEALDDGITNLTYGENFVVEAQVKNERRLSFVDIVISSGSTNKKYVFNEGHGQYQCQTTTIYQDDMWITDITISIDFSLVEKNVETCLFDTYLEVDEITFLNVSGGDAKASIKNDVKNLSIESKGNPKYHNWEMSKSENGSIHIECLTCHQENYKVMEIDEENKTISYGVYPQIVVHDETIIEELNALSEPYINDWYYYDGYFYAKNIGKFNVPLFNDNTSTESGKTYWFRCEPIIWNIVDNNDGVYSLLSSSPLDTHIYSNSNNNYKNSDIRSWLNNEFYNYAFVFHDDYIKITDVDNSAATTDTANNPFACENTQDKVFLPSCQDYSNFEKSIKKYSITDWVRAKSATEDYCWTRSPCGSFNFDTIVYLVDRNGELHMRNSDVKSGHGSIRPCISIAIEQ